MSGWLGPEYKSIDEMRARRDAAIWFFQYNMHAYPLLEEVDGYEFRGCVMPQDAIMALLSDQPVTQKLHTNIGTIGDWLDRLLKIRYRLFGYTRKQPTEVKRVVRWPKC